MTLQRVMLYVLTLLAGVGAVYFWAIHVAAAAAAALIVAVVLLVVGLVIRGKMRGPEA